MAEGKVDLPEDLSPVAKPAAEPWSAKDYGSGGVDEDKVLMGFLDESKDQVASENSIPLSPQWLYAKPSDGKVGLSTVVGDTRSPNSLPHGASLESTQRDVWRLDGSQDKKEWRRNMPDVEISRRWREEERDTSLLGRRERRKEGDRENEYRKNDRRSDITSIRETADSRTLPSSDRWHEVPNRNSGHESRRDSKWSSRWGPDDKEKDSRTEKKIDMEKDDPHAEKQSVVGSNRPLLDSDSRDKWRPRHRQEIHSGGSAVYRAAPGFGMERGRVEGPNVGFALGRGRTSLVGSLLLSRSSTGGPIGAAPSIKSDSLHGKFNLSVDTFRYPRGKLLDIYRKHKKQSSFDAIPDGFDEVIPLTQSSSLAPLAFIKPDSEEEAVLEDIWKGKAVSSEVHHNSSRERMERVDDCEIETDSDVVEFKEKINALSNGKDFGGMTSTVSKDVCNVPGSVSHSEQQVYQTNIEDGDRHVELQGFLNDTKFGAIDPTTYFDVCTKLPDDSNSLFNTPFIHEIPGKFSQHQNSDSKTELNEQGSSAELSFFYLDPEGNIQGPFLIEDIISWYDDGFFGTDLPVVLSDAPEGTPFRPLGEVIPDLSLRPQSTQQVNPGQHSEQSDTIRDNLESVASEFSNSCGLNVQQWTSHGSEDPFNHQLKPRISEPEVSTNSQYKNPPFSYSEISGGVPGAKRQSFLDFSVQDAEEVLYTGRSASNIQNPLGMLSSEIHDLSRTSNSHQFLLSQMGQANSTIHKVATDNDVNPLGLSWSELDGTHHKGPLSSNIAGIGDQGCTVNRFVGGDPRNREQFSVKGDSVIRDAWSNNYRRNTSSNVLHDVMDDSQLTHYEPESNRFNIEEHLPSQQFQKQQLQHQHLLSPHQNMHLSGSYLEQLQGSLHHQQSIAQPIPDMEHFLKLQLQQQRHLQQLEQHQQQHQLHHQMQLLQQQQQQQQEQQQQQLLLEQLMHQQLHDPSFGVSRGENALDQVLYRQRLLHELQQQAHHLPRDHDLSIDHLIQAKFGHNFYQEHHNELLDALPQPTRRHLLPLEQQLLLGLQQEQLQPRQFPIPSRQQPGMDEERHVGGVWSVDESGQFVRATASPHQTLSARLGQLDFSQPSQRPSSFEQPSHLERNFLLHDRMQRGNYGSNPQHFERSAVSPRPNVDLLSALSRLQGMDVPDQHGQMNSLGQMGQFPAGSHSQQNWMLNQFDASHLDAMERNWSESNGQLQNSLIESQLTQLHLAAEKQKRDRKADFSTENLNRWSSLVGNDESSNLSLADVLHQKLVLQSSQPLGLVDGAPTSSYENRDPSWVFSRPSAGHSFSLAVNNSGLGDSFAEDSLYTNLGQTTQERSSNLNLEGQASTFGNSGRLAFRSSSGALVEHKQYFSDIGEIEKQHTANSLCTDVSRERIDFSDLKEEMKVKQHGSKSMGMSRSVLDTLDGGVEQAGDSIIDHGALKVNGPFRHASFGGTGGGANLYNYEIGADSPYMDEMANDRTAGIFTRGSHNSLLKHSHESHILSSQGALPEVLPVPPMKGKNPTSFVYSDEVRRNPGENLATPVSESSSSSRKDMRFRRTSSYSDADAPEASFIDMLKGTRKPTLEADASAGSAESLDAGPGSRSSSKKKGKKGRQIDPSLLGFKVHSNRILMGEIQRPDD